MIARRLTAFVATGAIVLAACGGSDSPDPVAGAETGAPASPPADDATTDAPASSPAATPAPDRGDATDTSAATPTEAPDAPAAPQPTEAPGPSTAPQPTDAPVAVPEALDFTAQLLDGSEIELGAYAGRPVLLWFWAPW